MSVEPKREFTGVFIPAHIWEHPDLEWTEKCLIAEIHALGGHIGNCFASNAWLAKSMGVSERGIQKMLASLKQHGYLEERNFDGRKRYLGTLNMGERPKSDTNQSSFQTRTVVRPCNELEFVHKVQEEIKEEKKYSADAPDSRKILPAHKELIERWVSEYPDAHDGDKYLFQGGKDGRAVKQLLTFNLSLDDLSSLWRESWGHPKLFNCKLASSIAGFASRLNEIRQELKQNDSQSWWKEDVV